MQSPCHANLELPLAGPCTSYPLSPLQQGMLFHHLLEPSSGVDIAQLDCSLTERVDIVQLHKAWEKVVKRHAVLRTGFRWQGLADTAAGSLERRRAALQSCGLARCCVRSTRAAAR